jgi:hypothetical protein
MAPASELGYGELCGESAVRIPNGICRSIGGREGVASSQGRLPCVPVFDLWRGYDRAVIEDPLKSALEEITPKLDPGLEPLAAALLAEEPVEDAWATLLQEILDAA